MKKDAPTKASPPNTEYPKQASPNGAANYVKNANQAQKPKKNTFAKEIDERLIGL